MSVIAYAEAECAVFERKDAWKYGVYCDGSKLECCLAADARAGFAVCYAVSQTQERDYQIHFDRLVLHQGHIEIRKTI